MITRSGQLIKPKNDDESNQLIHGVGRYTMFKPRYDKEKEILGFQDCYIKEG